MIITLLATNIQYDWDGPGIPTMHNLPESLEVLVDLSNNLYVDVNRQVSTQISNVTGMLVLSFKLIGYQTKQPIKE